MKKNWIKPDINEISVSDTKGSIFATDCHDGIYLNDEPMTEFCS